jgi:hypothetical protein
MVVVDVAVAVAGLDAPASETHLAAVDWQTEDAGPGWGLQARTRNVTARRYTSSF